MTTGLSKRGRRFLTVVTLVWLLGLAMVNLRQTDRLYPVTSYSMFSYPTGGLNVQLDLDATTADGDALQLAPEDFGLTELQMRAFLARTVGFRPGQPRPGAQSIIADVASIWTERNDQDLSRVTVVRNEHSVDRPGAPLRTPIETWSR